MKKRALSFALTLVLIFALVPALSASASGAAYLESDIMGTGRSTGLIKYPAKGSFSMGGETYWKGIVCDKSGGAEPSITYNIAGQGFTRLSGKLGRIDGTLVGAMTITGDGRLLGGFEVHPGTPKDIEVAIPAGVERIVLYFQPYIDLTEASQNFSAWGSIGFADAFFDSGTTSQSPPSAAPDAVYLESDLAFTKCSYAMPSHPADGAFSMGGVTYFRGFTGGINSYATYNIAGLGFTKLSGTFGRVHGTSGGGTLTVTGDGTLLGGFEYSSGDVPLQINVDIPAGVQEITVRLQYTDVSTTRVGFAEAYFSGGEMQEAKPQPITITAISSPANGGSVSDGGTFQSGTSVTLTATPNSGWTFAGWYEGGVQVGTNATLTFNATQNRTLEARFTQREQGDLPFDNDHSDWAEKELIRAFDEDLFSPLLMSPDADLRAPITRVEFAGIVVKTFENLSGTKVSPAPGNPFSDTKDVYALMAYDANLMVGTSATTFAPDMILNRETAATALTRVFKKWHFTGWTYATDSNYTLDYSRPAPFADDAEISGWANDSVYFMAANKIILGFDGGTFRPKNMSPYQESVNYATATREQALIIALRMVENMR